MKFLRDFDFREAIRTVMNDKASPSTRVVVLSQPGGPEQLRVEEVSLAPVGPNDIRVRQTAVGVNYHDVYVRSGLYKTLALPGVPGIEAVGVVEEVGGCCQSNRNLSPIDAAMALQGRPQAMRDCHSASAAERRSL